MTYVAAGLVYVALADVPLRIRDASLVQLAASFMSKIIPSGIGATGLNARYLTKSGLDGADASALIVGQNLIGFVMFIVPLALFMLINGQSVGELFHVHIYSKVVILAVSLVALLVAALLFNVKLREKFKTFAINFITSTRDLTTSTRELIMASGASFMITIFYISCLYTAIHALGAHITLGGAIIIYATAVIAKTALPTPGGLGPVEVAMSASLVAAGIPAGQAFAIVILYRLATFWIPIPFSIVAYKQITSKRVV